MNLPKKIDLPKKKAFKKDNSCRYLPVPMLLARAGTHQEAGRRAGRRAGGKLGVNREDNARLNRDFPHPHWMARVDETTNST